MSKMAVPESLSNSLSEVLLSGEVIARRVEALGAEMSAFYKGERPVLVAVLKGSYIFAADLSRAMTEDHEIEFIRASSYLGTESSGAVEITGLEDVSLEGRHVVLVEDIVDTGLTLKTLIKRLESLGASSVKCCTFLRKLTDRRQPDTPKIDFVAFDIPDKFVVGYGLDVDQRFRHLPFVGVYKAS